MKTVFKYPLVISDYQNIDMPKGAKPLFIDVQNGLLTLWALVDPAAKMTIRRLRIAGTGHAIDDAGQLVYIGSALMAGGRLVWHVFDAGEV